MKVLQSNVDDLFAAFESGESIDLVAHQNAICKSLETAKRRFGELEEMQRLYNEIVEENGKFRKLLSADLRRRLFMLGESDADKISEESMTLPVEDLLKKYSSILEDFDRKFTVKTVLPDSLEKPEKNQYGVVRKDCRMYSV